MALPGKPVGSQLNEDYEADVEAKPTAYVPPPPKSKVPVQLGLLTK